MSVIDTISGILSNLPRGNNNSLTLHATDFALDEVTLFFQNALAGQALTLDNATITPGPQAVSVGGQAELLGYTGLTTLLTFQSADNSEDSSDELIIRIRGDFDITKSITLPAVSWIGLGKLGMEMVQTTEFGILAFTIYGSIVVNEVSIPVVIGKTGDADWSIAIAEDQSIALPDLNHLAKLVGGEAAASFFPQPLVDAITGIAVGGIACQFNTTAGSVAYFTVTISVTNSWQIASKIEILAGMSLSLVLVNPVGSAPKSVIGTVRGTAQFNGHNVPMFVQGSAGSSTMWSVGILPDDAVQLPGISTLLELAGGEDFFNTLPAGFRTIPDILINYVLIDFDPVQRTLNLISFAISTAQQWEIIAGYFAINNLSMEMTINNLTTPAQRSILGTLMGTFKVEDIYLQFILKRTAPSDDWSLTGGLPPNQSVNLTGIAARLFDGIATIPSDAPVIAFSQLSITVTPATQKFVFTAQSTNTWDFGKVQVKTFLLQFSRDPKNVPALAGTIATTLGIAGVDLFLSAALNDAASQGWQFNGHTGKDQLIHIGELIAYIEDKFGVKGLPDWFTGITLENLVLDFNTHSSNFHFAVTGTFPISSGTLVITVKIGVEKQVDTTYKKVLDGTITFGSAIFNFDFITNTTTNSFSATWKEIAGQTLGFHDIAGDLGFTPPDIPSDLDLALRGAAVTYDSAKKELVLSADSANYGKAVFVTLQNNGQQQYFFALGVDKTINLSNLPLVGTLLSHVQTVTIGQLQVLIANDKISPATAALVNPLIPTGYPVIPTNGTASQLSLVCTINFGGDIIPLSLGMGAAQSSANTTSVGPAQGQQTTSVTTTPPAATDGTTWFNVQKTFGPVTFSKVGVQYKDGLLWFLLNASLSAGGVTISLDGLSVGSSIKDFDPHFNLAGLGLDVQEPPIEIGGGLLHVPAVAPITFEFDGAAVIKAPEFSISAYGSYADLSGQPSMFIFAQIQHAFGGPPMFFVTGLAAGFGYNSNLRIPAQDEIANFPFVAGLTNPSVIGGSGASPLAALAKLTGGPNPWVAPALGQIWIAAGIMFTSFELIQSNALLVAEFGNELTIALIGLSTAKFPPEGSNAYAQVELELEAIFQPSKGIFSVTAVLSRNSFLLDPACMLVGGFAFYIWFQNSAHDGDFVITLGGYNPMFDKPGWYPVEPRVGFNWSLDSTVSISGSAYFALTPSAIMAGGALAINFHDGNLSAWFIAHADLIIWWKPFHFYASIGVSIGVSYKLDLLFTTKTISVELGADLELWGPPVGGVATIHWWVISFTVSFGSQPSNPPDPLKWEQFQTLLPQSKDVVRIVPINGLAAEEKISTKSRLATVAASVDLPVAPTRWIVRADNFQFTTSSSLPSSQVFLSAQGTTPFKEKDKLNIRPMQATNLVSTHRVSIQMHGGPEVVLDSWSALESTGNVPKALWGTGAGSQLEKGDEQLIADQLTGLSLTVPTPSLGHSTGQIDIENDLSYDPLTPDGLSPLVAGLPSSGDVAQAGQNSIKVIESEIMSASVKANRDLLFAALRSLNYDPGTNDPLTTLASKAGYIYEDEPMIVAQT